jgi:hypothetical protein
VSKKNIVTILLIILIGILITDININGVGVFELYFNRLNTESIEKLNIRSSNHEKYTLDDSMSFKANKIESLKIYNPMGSVILTGEEREDIKVDYSITVYSETKKRAEGYAEQLEVEKKGRENIKLSVSKLEDTSDIRSIKVAYHIKAPQDIYLNIRNKYGKLKVNNFKNGVELSNAYEDTIIKDISGEKIDIEVRYGDLNVTNLKGNATIDTAYNNADLSEINKDLDLNADYSDITGQNIEGKLVLKTKYGKASFNNIDQIELNSNYTDIDISNINGYLIADMDYGELEVFGVKNDLNITGDYTDIEVDLASELENYNLDCELEHANIDANFLISLKEEGNYKRATKKVGTGEVKLQIVTEYGDVELNQ